MKIPNSVDVLGFKYKVMLTDNFKEDTEKGQGNNIEKPPGNKK